MNFEIENLQWFMEQFNEDFGTRGKLNLLVDVDKMLGNNRKIGYDLVVYDVSDLDVSLVNATELSMYCFEYGLEEEDFEIERVSLVEIED